MLICSTLNEISPAAFDPALANVTLAEVAERVKTRAGFGAGYGERSREMVEAYAKAFPGDSNGGGLPQWPRYKSAQGETMVLDDVSVAKNDPDREVRRALPAP